MNTKNVLITKDNHFFSTLFFADLFFFLPNLIYAKHCSRYIPIAGTVFTFNTLYCFPLSYLAIVSCLFNVLVFFPCSVYIGDLSFSCAMNSPQAISYTFIVSPIATSRTIFPISWSFLLGGLTPASHIFHDTHHATSSATHTHGHSLQFIVN